MDMAFMEVVQSSATSIGMLAGTVGVIVWAFRQKWSRVDTLETENDKLREEIADLRVLSESRAGEIDQLRNANSRLSAEVKQLQKELQSCMNNWNVVLTQTGAIKAEALATLISERQ